MKIAARKDRSTALIRCAIHILPLSGALVLLFLNFSWYSVGNDLGYARNFDASAGLTGLQFAAKFHELLMVASLTTALLSYTRACLISEHGLPFGAAFAGLQVGDVGRHVRRLVTCMLTLRRLYSSLIFGLLRWAPSYIQSGSDGRLKYH